MNVPQALQRYREEIASEVASIVPADSHPLYESIRYQLGWSPPGLPQLGKCIRPTLCLLACDAVGGDRSHALPAAAAIELIHNFSLIHDDIEDEDDVRHHRPTVWAAFGRDRGVVSGLALWSLAYKGLERALDAGASPQSVVTTRAIIAEACDQMIEGQHLDLSYETRGRVTLVDYAAMIESKTGALVAASLQVGALLGGAPAEEIDRFGEFGRNLGISFQIRDDVLGIWGEGSATGKPVGADIAKRKKSLPIVHALEHVVGPDKNLLRHIYEKPSIDEADVAAVLDILQRWNVRYFAGGLAEDYRARAMAALAQTHITSEARHDFDELMSFMLERDF